MFEWDEEKNRWTREHRGLDFSIVYEFDWEKAVVTEDKRKEYGELRFLAYGMVGDRLLNIVFTPRGDTMRIISMRHVHRKEGKRYGFFKDH